MSCNPTADYNALCNQMNLTTEESEECSAAAANITKMCTNISQEQCIYSEGYCAFQNEHGTITQSKRTNAHAEHAGFFSVLRDAAAAAQGTDSS